MATIYTDALYSATNLGTVASTYFSLSSLNNEVVLVSAGGGTNFSPVVGVAYNSVDLTAGTTTTNSGAISALAVRKTLTISPLSAGVASGEAPTTLTVGVSAVSGISLALLYANGQASILTYQGTTTTYTVQASARSSDVSDPNDRRMHNMGYR
jgi:hypothetical protein